jgi:hypothetical protein
VATVSRRVVRREKTDDPKMPVSDVCAMFILFQGLTLIVGLQVQRRIAPSRTKIGKCCTCTIPCLINAAMQNVHG